MAKVKLKRDWLAANGQYFRESRNPNEVPDNLLDHLPSDAEVIGEDDSDRKERRAASVDASRKSVADMKKTGTAFKD